MSSSINQIGGVVHALTDATTICQSTVTNDTFCEESFLDDEQKKRKVEDVYSDGRFANEDEYEIMKVRKVIRTHIFKHVKFCKGEGNSFRPNPFEKKKAKIKLYGKSHEKADLSKRIGYEYHVMKLVGYDENKRSLTDRALWWKTYNIHVIEEIRQLRGRVSTGMKKNIIKG